MSQASPELIHARGTLLKDLIRSSPKRFQAIVVDDISSSEDEDYSIEEKKPVAKQYANKQCNKKSSSKKWTKPSPIRALLFDSSDDEDSTESESYEEFTAESDNSEISCDSEESYESEDFSDDSEYESECSDISYDSDSDDDCELPVPAKGVKPLLGQRYFTASGAPKRSPYVERKMLERGIENNHSMRGYIPSPQVIISPKRQPAISKGVYSKQSRIEDIITKRQEKLRAAKEAERKRIEEEAIAKAKEEQEKARKEQVKKILDDLKAKQSNPRRYVAVYFNPEKRRHQKEETDSDDFDTDSDSSFYDSEETYSEETESESYSEASYDSSDDEDIDADISRLTKIAGKLTTYGKKIKKMTNTSLSPKKRSHN